MPSVRGLLPPSTSNPQPKSNSSPPRAVIPSPPCPRLFAAVITRAPFARGICFSLLRVPHPACPEPPKGVFKGGFSAVVIPRPQPGSSARAGFARDGVGGPRDLLFAFCFSSLCSPGCAHRLCERPWGFCLWRRPRSTIGPTRNSSTGLHLRLVFVSHKRAKMR